MSWDAILGQELAKRVWQIHLAAGTISGAYLLAGPDGVGKRRLALEMAKALNCVGDEIKPCDICPPCAQIGRGTHPDVHLLIPSGASQQIKIDDVRHLIGRIALRPFSAKVQVAIIDGAEHLTEEAANSLLKSLEEPSVHTRFLLTTTQLDRCLATVVSRCQLIRCQPLPLQAVKQILLDTQGCDSKIAEVIARLSGGSASKAIDLQTRWAAQQRLLTRFATEMPIRWVEQPLPETRDDVIALLESLVEWLRDLAMTAVGDSTAVAHQGYDDALHRQAEAMDVTRCVETAFEVMALRESVDQFVSPRLIAALAREKWLSLMENTMTSVQRPASSV